MANFFRDNADLRYYFDKGIDWATLARFAELGFRDEQGFPDAAEALVFYTEVASRVGEFVADEVAPHAAEIDREGVGFQRGEVNLPPRLRGVFEKLGELGLYTLNLPRELGGMNAPMLLYFVNSELFGRADASVMSQYGFHAGTATAMFVLSVLEGSTEFDPASGRVLSTRFAREIAEVASGAAWGSMDITESDAGSDMAALRTRAEQDAEGRWRITGRKVFITSGHGKYHFVVARSESAAGESDPRAGLAGLSLFLVRAYEDGAEGRHRLATLDRIEQKLGLHGSVTASLTFDGTPAELVGKRGEGFRQMLDFMNHARLGVAFECIGVCEAALRMARGYARDRRSMGKTLDRHEIVFDYLDEMESDIVGLRALSMHAAFEDELAYKKALFGRFVARDVKEGERFAREADGHRRAARLAIPLVKYLAAEKAVEMTRRCLQIHGGNGYMREFGAEKLVRDALVMPIYEGTSQIQALMAMKDALSAILKAPQRFVARLARTRLRALSARDPLARRVAGLAELSLSAQQHLVAQTLGGKLRALRAEPLSDWPSMLRRQWNPKRDFSFALLHAERLTRLLADVAIADVLLEQANRDDERRAVLERHVERAEPRVRFLHDQIKNSGGGVLERLAREEKR